MNTGPPTFQVDVLSPEPWSIVIILFSLNYYQKILYLSYYLNSVNMLTISIMSVFFIPCVWTVSLFVLISGFCSTGLTHFDSLLIF